MLIVCPSCATSYQIDPGSVGGSGRMVRCARCRATWFAAAPAAGTTVDAFVDSVIAEAEAEQAPRNTPPAAAREPTLPAATNIAPPDDFGDREDAPGSVPEIHVPEVETAHFAAAGALGAAETGIVTMDDSPSLVPPIEHMPLPEPGAKAEDDSESFVARRRRLQTKRQKSRRSSRWTAIVLVLFAFNVALIGARNEVVRYLPQTASLFAAIGLPVNLRQLDFENVHITRETQGGASILLVAGKIVSKGRTPLKVPRLRFAARNGTGQEVYVWTAKPERNVLKPGETLDFQSSLAKPPADATDVMVRFFTASDAMAGAK
ncbi:MAG TPA: zinc-ribbon domain-containing protein [Pseudolabrys sp.]|nr:zinc-ribbon domain-containing protein [Pseudolabrys sp.]